MKLSNGQQLYRQGDVSKAMYVIRSGKITLYVQRGDKPVELLTLGPGQVVGDLAFFNGQVRTSNARAVGETEVIEVVYDQIRGQFEEAPSWLQILSKTLAEQVVQYSRQLKQMKASSDPRPLPIPVVNRILGALATYPSQFGIRQDNRISVEWSALRSYLAFVLQESGPALMNIAKILAKAGIAELVMREGEPVEFVVLNDAALKSVFQFHHNAYTKNQLAQLQIDERALISLRALNELAKDAQRNHKGVVTVNLVKFTETAARFGGVDLQVSAVDYLTKQGLQLQKSMTQDGVTVSFHPDEFAAMEVNWTVCFEVQKINGPEV